MSDDILQAKINLETARLAWRELARYFAAGRVIHIAATLDLTAVARKMATDDAAYIQRLMTEEKLQPVSDKTALAWEETNPQLWTVVIKPWVLVQETNDDQATD